MVCRGLGDRRAIERDIGFTSATSASLIVRLNELREVGDRDASRVVEASVYVYAVPPTEFNTSSREPAAWLAAWQGSIYILPPLPIFRRFSPSNLHFTLPKVYFPSAYLL